MSSRFYRGTFWMGILACTLPMAGAIMAFSPSQDVPDVRGVWDGFYVTDDGATGQVESNISQQHHRRLEGDGKLLDPRNGDESYRFDGTLAHSDFITGEGTTRRGRMTFQADLDTFAGRGGEAGVMTPEYHFVASRCDTNRVSAVLLHPFPGVARSEISGSGLGSFVSLSDPNHRRDVPDPNFHGVGRMLLGPHSARGTFAGRVEFFIDSSQAPVISWPLLATAGDDGHVVMIGQGAAGRITYDGGIIPSPNPESPSALWGFFRLRFSDGQSQFGAINFNLSR